MHNIFQLKICWLVYLDRCWRVVVELVVFDMVVDKPVSLVTWTLLPLAFLSEVPVMIIAVAVLAVAAIALLALLVSTRNSAAAAQQAAEQRERELESAKAALEEDVNAKSTALDEANDQIATLESDVTSHKATVKQVRKELKAAKSQVADQGAQIEKQLGQVADLLTERTTLQGRLAESEATRAAAVARNVGIVIDEELAGDDARTKALWELELLRSDRTWRTAVAVDPNAPHSPFDDTDDPVRLAVEVEAAALRENVGNAVDVLWEAPEFGDPGRSHLVVRVAQEMLESAARCNDPTKLVVSVDDATLADDETDGEAVPGPVRIQLQPLDEQPEEDLLNFIPPRITSELIDLTEDGVVTVSQAKEVEVDDETVIDLTDGAMAKAAAAEAEAIAKAEAKAAEAADALAQKS